MSSSKVCKMEVEGREGVWKEGTRREDERREEGGQGGCELAPPGQSLSLPACPPGLAAWRRNWRSCLSWRSLWTSMTMWSRRRGREIRRSKWSRW